ncbi:MAG: peptidoglycan editing factor PgeF [Deltaproteobacteria bacterium HGW-Deltaproteobacteria-11]|nr:MAG: peptidoglycan editing factor PgeF [Deltaproteobacteria bacterium HGW-Deltaproteobacteria-11]
MFRIAQKASIKYLECLAERDLDFVIHAFCTRQGGVSGGSFASLNVSAREGEGDDPVRLNFESIAAAFGITVSQFLPVHQVHRDGVWVVNGRTLLSAHDPPPECDAVVTDRPGIALCIKTADCVPVFLIDPIRRVIGAVHAGWRGTALQIVEKAVGEMVQRFGARPSDLFAAIGPAIGPCCYEVDAGVYHAMSNHPERDSFFHARREEGKWMLDLFLANRQQLLRSGLPPERIRTADHCTACHPELFFSHRAQGGYTGRQLNFIMIR